MSEELKTLQNALSASLASSNEDGNDPLSTGPINYPTESRIESIILSKKNEAGEEITFSLFPWNPTVSVTSPFRGFTFKESIYSGCMFGSLFVSDLKNWIDEFQFTGIEKLELKMKIGQSGETVTFKFHVYDSKLVSNDADTSQTNPSDERSSFWKIDVVSSEIFLPHYYNTFLETNEDFIGNLSENYDGSVQPTVGDENEFFEQENQTKKENLVNAIFDKFKLPVGRIDSSRTGVWLKSDHVAYPWMKRKGQMRVSQLLKYLANYAWDGNTSKYSCDYYWWEDRNGWNFRSLSKMISTEDGSKLKEPVEGFIVSVDETNPNRLIEIEVINEYNILNLLSSGALTSYYKRHDPNYNNVYLDFTDSSESIKVQNLTYDYHERYNDITQIGNYKLIADSFDTNPFLENGNPKEAVRFDDEIYGYFNNNFLNTPYGQQWETYGKTASTPWSKVAWQPQFDLTDLSFETFKVIHKDIRIPLKKKREEYARKKNIKRKWETYRCTICCHENGAIGSTKDIELFNNPGAVDGYTYNALFGPTGMFSNVNEEYKLVAAGSFTDLINYDAGNTFYERGLTYSYDLTKEPYNQTIGQFFNITGPTVPTAYSEFVINRSLRLYNIFIQKMEDRITDLEDFVTNRCKTYKQTADDIFTSVLLNKESNTIRSIDLTQGFRYVGDAIVGEKITDWPSTEVEYGILPHSSIPQNKGVGQVVFGDPPPEQRSITFRSLELPENGNQNQGDGGVAQECYTLAGFESGCCDCCIAQCTGQVVPESCNPVGQGGGCNTYCDCPEVTKYCCNPNSTVAAYRCITLTYNPLAPGSSPTECSQVGGQESSSCSACTDPDGSLGACWTTDGCYNAPESECQGVYLGPGTPCTPVPDNATIILIVGQGREGPQGPQGPTGPTGATGPTGPSGLPTEEDLRYVPYEAFQDCSQDPIIRGFIKYKTETSRDNYSPIYLYAAPYLWDDDTIKDWSYFDYGSESGLIPAISSSSTRKETRDCLEDSGPNGCYNTTCLSSVALEVLRRTCIGELELLKKEVELFKQIRDKISNEYISRWRNAYTEWHERNAFFFSKKPGESIFRKEQPLTGDESDFFSADSNEPKINSPLSLQNIKTITRKEIRGSRYELLSRYEGITGASAAAWKYNIFLGGNSGSTGHPYYDQKYNSKKFITSREPHKWFVINNSNDTDDLGADFEYPARYRDQRGFGDYGPQYGVGAESEQNSAFHLGLNEWVNISIQGTYNSYGYAQSDLNTSTVPIDLYKDTFNFYDLENKKPPNIKKEEISSYVRVEFRNPIGLDTVSNFPNGFVRDAGTEYFLPYIVNLTVGPIGKQSVKYNAAVIGMDPYGFDVAVKKIKDDIPINRRLQGIDKGNYYKWWNHDTGSVLSKTEYLSTDYNGMDLWPEIGFETEFPYYAYDPMQEDMHGGGYDLDFHNGGGYYFENESQDWMESLYHYGMSSGKQFDPLYRSSVVGSYILPNSYRKLKPHRSWWSLFVPRNLFIPIRFANILQTPNTKARSTFGTRGVFSISSNYWKSWYGNEFENWLTLSPNSTNLLWSDTEISFYVDIGDVPGVAVPNATPQKSISTLTTNEQNSVQTYFNDSLMNYLGSNYTLYRPNLVETELWKWDLSGETEYGLITPPVDTEYEFFDRNFSIQFTVHARNKSLTCESIGLKCANPEAIKNGPIVSAGGCTAAPYCNCPAQYNIPTEPEPTYLELYKLKNEISECSLISEKLDESWLGCNYSEPDSPGSCSCPEQGENYKYYLEYDRTYATFWETPLDLPLRRLAQTNQYDAQKIRIRIPPNGNVKIGDIVELINPNDTPDLTANEFKKISGRWMISEIGHNLINSFSYLMDLTLIRNSLQYDINKSQSPSSTFTTNT